MPENTVKIKGTPALAWLLETKRKIKVLQGAARSGKTIAIAQRIILKCVNEFAGQNKIITIARKTFPALRASVMRDFFNLLQEMRLYSSENHNKTNHEYRLHGNLIEFVAADQEQKWRGRQRDILWLNEANEFEYDDFLQGIMRTTGEVYMDYNPSDEFHWIYEKVLPRNDVDYREFTIFDNPLAPEAVREEILRLKEQDENLWKIYGLGQRGKAQDLIYTNWDIVDDFPHICTHYRYGLDYGYNHPTALVFVGINGNDVYVREVIYQTHLTNQDLIDLMKLEKVSPKVLMRADSAEPDRIYEINRAGFNIEGVDKTKASIKQGIDSLKRRKIHIVKSSVNVIKEIKNYRWKRDKKTDEITDEPLKFKDDAMDALRYAVGDLLADSFLFREEEWDFIQSVNLPRQAKDNRKIFQI